MQALLRIRWFVAGHHPHAARIVKGFGPFFIGSFHGRSAVRLVDCSYELFIIRKVLLVVVSDFPLGVNGANLKIVFGANNAVLAIAVSDYSIVGLLRDETPPILAEPRPGRTRI